MASAPEFRLPQIPHFLFVCLRQEEASAQDAVGSLFQQHKFDVAKDAEAAVKAVENTHYDVIFIAENLEKQTADLVAEALRARQVVAPLVCLSETMGSGARHRCQRVGIDYMINPKRLRAFLERHMGGAGREVGRTLILGDAPRILIIDDMPRDFKVVSAKSVIEVFYPNAKVVVVESGDEALEQLKGSHFNLVLIDYNLADEVTGDMVAAQLRKHDQSTYFLGFSTDMENSEKKGRCLAAGMDDGIQPRALAALLGRCQNSDHTQG